MKKYYILVVLALCGLLYSTISEAQTWSKVTPTGYSGQIGTIYGFNSNFLIAKLSGNWDAIYSTDKGITWVKMDTVGLYNPSIYQSIYKIFHTSNNTLLVVVNDALAPSKQKLYRSTNFGASWTKITGTDTLPVGFIVQTIFQDSNNDIYIFSSQLLKSSDDGATFTIHKPYPVLPGSNSVVEDSYGSFYASTSTGRIFKSTDKGLSWTINTDKLYSGGGTLYSPTITINNNTLYACGYGDKVIFSADTGNTWTKIDPVFVGNPDIIRANNSGEVIVADGANKQIYITTDNGTTWNLDTNGYGNKVGVLTWYNMSSLTTTSDGCFFAVNMGELYKQCPGGNPSVPETNKISEQINIFPNPASEQLAIKVEHTLIGSHYQITDVLSRIILSGKINSAEEKIDVSSLDRGVYILNLKGKKSIQSKVLVF